MLTAGTSMWNLSVNANCCGLWEQR